MDKEFRRNVVVKRAGRDVLARRESVSGAPKKAPKVIAATFVERPAVKICSLVFNMRMGKCYRPGFLWKKLLRSLMAVAEDPEPTPEPTQKELRRIDKVYEETVRKIVIVQ